MPAPYFSETGVLDETGLINTERYCGAWHDTDSVELIIVDGSETDSRIPVVLINRMCVSSSWPKPQCEPELIF